MSAQSPNQNTMSEENSSQQTNTLSTPTFWENGMAPGSIANRVKRMNRERDPNAYALWSEWCVLE